MKLIAAGGIRDGVDLAKAIRLAADIAGQAAGVLRGDDRGGCRAFRDRHRALGWRCFCTASADPAALRQARLLPLAHLPAG
ncbi:isopentenyl diphosphate isomerase/L-lactate dehydrogenase-like FMN-dependent dehydrogenase [Bradyrhizobium sp. F1.13.3]